MPEDQSSDPGDAARGAKYTYPFDPDAENNTAATIHRLARRGGRRVLDVGSGPGIVAGALASGAGKDVTCIDVDVDALERARAAGVAATHLVDLRDAKWYAELAGTTYDTVVLADVLEHVVDPERILRDIRREGLVADDGQLVVSIPNANHESVLVELATGHFGYTETGLLDSTHVRFFTLESITALLESCGFGVVEVHRTLKPFGHTQHNYRYQELPELVRAALPSLGLQGRTYQYVLLVRPSTDAARIAGLNAELEAARKAVHDARVTADRLQRRLDEVQALLVEERAEAAKALAAATDRADVEKELELARKRIATAEREARTVRNSSTFKAGLAVKRAAQPVVKARTTVRRGLKKARGAAR